MTIRSTYAAESWDKVYTAFQQINFTAYDYDTVKESLLQYLKIYHSENFNDLIESSEMIALLELFAYVAELLAYRVDTMAHENFITTAQRKQSILRLARLISYRASRNIPARGLVKMNTVRTTEQIFDSLGNDLSNTTILWNDPNNTNWKEQFFLVMNKILTNRFGQPSKAFQINDVLMQLYTFNNADNSFRNGVFSFSATGASEQVQMEVVPADIDENGPYERAPDNNAQFNILYSSDGKGDGSDYTGFLMFVKQGTLVRTDYEISEPTANRRLELDAININDTDVWVYRVDDSGSIIENWAKVETLNEQNLYFNNQNSTRKKYEIETLENDRIALLFGDGNFSDAPVGKFQLWTRISVNQDIMIPKNRITGKQLQFTYLNQANNSYQCSLSFSLTAAIQNNSSSETIEHVRQSAPSTYYAQNRMVNGQDYNTFMLKDQTILRLKTINRTFAGQPKYIEWNDASRNYENTKLYGDDLSLAMDISADQVETRVASKSLVDAFVEPLLQTNALLNTLVHASVSELDGYGIVSYPRRRFIEDNRPIYRDIDGNPVNPYGKKLDSTDVQPGDGSLNERSAIQSALDQHWYGDAISFVTINGIRHGLISDPILAPTDDGKLYASELPRTIDGVNTYPPGDIGSGIQQVPNYKYFGLRYNRFLSAFGDGDIALLDPNDTRDINDQPTYGYGDNISVPWPVPTAYSPGVDYYKHKVEAFTIEMTSDGSTFTVISNIRGAMPNYSLTAAETRWSAQADKSTPIDFVITPGLVNFEEGDTFVIDVWYGARVGISGSPANPPPNQWNTVVRKFGVNAARKANLNGWWEIIPSDVILGAPTVGGAGLFQDGPNDGPNLVQRFLFDTTSKANSWVFLIARNDNVLGEVESWFIYNRNIKIIAESPTTKFWYNQDAQIIDSETKKPVYDKIRILRSNLDELGKPLMKAHIYDTVGIVYDDDGVPNLNQIEVLPTDTENFTRAGDKTPDNILQFETFAADSYEYILINAADASNQFIIKTLDCSEYEYIAGYDLFDYDINLYDSGQIIVDGYGPFQFIPGDLVSNYDATDTYRVARRKRVPAPATVNPVTGNYECNVLNGLDFMWQHFSPVTHLIDPSVSNIHDSFIMTRGYYTSMIDYVKGVSSIQPEPPTPLDLRTAYGYLLQNKMLSDTVVLHSGKIKLLFGTKADQRLRAKFRVVKAPNATFSDERIKSEIIDVVDTYFNIQNWDFGDKFYATELISLIHQRLPTQISSVVLVPMYSVNSFGSLFTIDSGFDEILQSAATVNDVEIVDALTPTVLRQIR